MLGFDLLHSSVRYFNEKRGATSLQTWKLITQSSMGLCPYIPSLHLSKVETDSV